MDSYARILIVDDERFHLNVISELLGEEYTTIVAKSGEKALEIARSQHIDLILLDVLMPEMDGYAVCEQLKRIENTKDTPIIFLTAKSSVEDQAKGFDLGAVDYITKPVSPPIVRARVKNHLALYSANKSLLTQNEHLEDLVAKRSAEIVKTQDVAIYCLTSLVETRDNETGDHIRRTQNYVKILAEYLKDHPRFKDQLNDEVIAMMFKSAPLHDIGKVGIPDHILLKPGKLTPEEWEIMKTHAALGEESIRKSEALYGTSSFLHYAKEIAGAHHEKWNGQGYPRGLQGDEIPLSGRLMAVADVYDALISKRVYKSEFTHEKAVELILSEKGQHFDPDIVDAFAALVNEFNAIAHKYAD